MMRFVVLATPRSGSNWLCSLLDSHPDVLCHHELFNPQGIHTALSQRAVNLGFGSVKARDRDPQALLEKVWQRHLGRQAVGFKLNRGQAPRILTRVLADRAIRKIVIYRRNPIRSYVSERIAERSGEWESYAGMKISPSPRPVLVTPEGLHRHAEENRAFYNSLDEALGRSGQHAFRLAYEEVGKTAVQQRLLSDLGVAPEVPLKAGTRRQNPAPLRRLIANFDALAEDLRGTALERDLQEDDVPAAAVRREA